MPISRADTRKIIDSLPFARDPDQLRKRIELLELLLERSFVIPGTNRRFGLDAVAGLVPVFGDVLAAVLGCYLIWEARNLGMPKWKLLRMAGNVGVDTLIGSVPLVGDIFDFLYSSNSRNLKIIKRHLDKHHPAAQMIEG
jgi:hypothetical protein